MVHLPQDLAGHTAAVDKLPPVIQGWAGLPHPLRQAGSEVATPAVRHLAENLHGAAVDEMCLHRRCESGVWSP